MQTFEDSDAASTLAPRDNGEVRTSLERWLPPLLSVIAGMADLIGFFTLGNIFTAHLTGNLVLATAGLVRHAPVDLAQVLAIPVFMLALVGVWLVARASGRRSLALVRLLLMLQFLLLVAVLAVSVRTKASTDPEGLMATVAAMIAVAAIACQYALFRVAMPDMASTAVMTGNLTTAVLLSMNLLSRSSPSTAEERSRLLRAVWLLVGFLSGCAIAGMAVSRLADWAWIFPVTLAGAAALLVMQVPDEKGTHVAST